jgi:hypothetical protein
MVAKFGRVDVTGHSLVAAHAHHIAVQFLPVITGKNCTAKSEWRPPGLAQPGAEDRLQLAGYPCLQLRTAYDLQAMRLADNRGTAPLMASTTVAGQPAWRGEAQ